MHFTRLLRSEYKGKLPENAITSRYLCNPFTLKTRVLHPGFQPFRFITSGNHTTIIAGQYNHWPAIQMKPRTPVHMKQRVLAINQRNTLLHPAPPEQNHAIAAVVLYYPLPDQTI